MKNNNIFSFFLQGSKRSIDIKKNIIASFVLKVFSICLSMIIVPVTLNYVDSVEYGLWLTISSMVAWLTYFDMGFTNGFRNKFTESVANGDYTKSREYVSTTYISLGFLFLIFAIIGLIVNNYINWSAFLNISIEYESKIRYTMQYLIIFFCINFVAKTFNTMLIALQKPALSSTIDTIGQFGAMLAILYLTRNSTGTLENLVFVFSGIPCITLIILSILTFRYSKFKIYSPSFTLFRRECVKVILSVGLQLFFILVSMLVIFQLINVVITRYLGAESVTQYNICYKYFNIITMVTSIIVTPFWSAFTEAYASNDFKWMQSAFRKLDRLKYLILIVLLFMLGVSNFFFNIWIGDKVEIPFSMSIIMSIMMFFLSLGQMYMYMVNGTSKFFLQMIIYIFFSIISLPIMIYMAKSLGVIGVLIVPTITYMIQAVFGRIQIKKIINNTARGIWNR